MEKQLYAEILAKIHDFCNKVPEDGDEISYLVNSTEVLDLYRTAGGILDGDVTQDSEEAALDKVLRDLEKIV